MVVPVSVPDVAGRTVVHNTIVYGDKVLNLKEKGKDLLVTNVEVGKYSFECCVRMILEENPEVVFNTVQYSYQHEEAYFYTDKPISKEKWEKRNEEKKDPLSTSFLEAHVRELLSSDRILNLDCISLYDVLALSRKKEDEEVDFKASINSILKSIDDDYYVCVYDMNYITLECQIKVMKYRKHGTDNEEKFCFKKIGNDIYISKKDGDNLFGDEILGLIGDEISELYDYQLKQNGKKDGSAYGKECVNSDFIVDMSQYGVTIYSESAFMIKTYSYSDNIDYECNSAILMQLLKGNVYNLYRKIFVKIDDCPKWMQEELYEIRRQQVIEEEKERQKKLKKQKRREFWKKVIPFIK